MANRNVLDRMQEDLGDLIARHDRGKDFGEFKRYKDTASFGMGELGVKRFAPGQLQMFDSVRDNPLTVVFSCNGFGKDHGIGVLSQDWVYRGGGLCILTSAVERQVREVLFGEIRRLWSPNLPGELYTQTLRIPDQPQAGILGMVSSDPSKLTGHHAPRVLYVISEAQGVEDFVFEAALACAVGPEDRVLAVGNPVEPKGAFFEASRSPDWHSIQLSAFDHPNVIEGRVVIPGAITREAVERFKNQYGEDSPQYRARVLGEFPTEATHALIRRAWIDTAVEQWKEQDRKGWSGKVSQAIDVAYEGADRTAVAWGQNGAVRRVTAWSKHNFGESTIRIEEEARAMGLSSLSRIPTVVDAAGLGIGLFEKLEDLGVPVTKFSAGSNATDPEEFYLNRSEAAWLCREALRRGMLPLPPDPELHEELLAWTWLMDARGRITLGPKEDVRSQLRRSPDLADAVFMLCWLNRPTEAYRLPKINMGMALEGTTQRAPWKIM